MALDHGNVHIIKSRTEWDEKLSEAAASGKVVVVDFTASWCAPCQFIAPHFEALSKTYTNLIFLKVDVDEHSAISEEYEVHAMPTFLFILGPSSNERIVGANKVELEKKVKFHAEKQPVTA